MTDNIHNKGVQFQRALDFLTRNEITLSYAFTDEQLYDVIERRPMFHGLFACSAKYAKINGTFDPDCPGGGKILYNLEFTRDEVDKTRFTWGDVALWLSHSPYATNTGTVSNINKTIVCMQARQKETASFGDELFRTLVYDSDNQLREFVELANPGDMRSMGACQVDDFLVYVSLIDNKVYYCTVG